MEPLSVGNLNNEGRRERLIGRCALLIAGDRRDLGWNPNNWTARNR
jgi:hypothetical protein